MYKFIVIAFLFLFTTTIQSEIFEIENLEVVRPYITSQKDLVLFDIDDTLITNPFSLGTPAWRNWVRKNLPEYNLDFALLDALTLFIAKNAPYVTVEPSTANFIEGLQNQDFCVFAFTARGRTQWYTTDMDGVDFFTHQQLQGAGIDFKSTSIPFELQNLDPMYFHKGIIFAQHIKKGDLLKLLFKNLNYRPHAIIFVDDKLEQVQSVEAAVKEIGIPFFGFWYKRMDLEGAKFNPTIANLQLEALLLENQILSDDRAKERLPDVQERNPSQQIRLILDKIDLKLLTPVIP